MIANKKEFTGGLLLMAGFWVVFAILMSPVFQGKNCLDFMDNLYNTISKSSSYYIPAVQKKAEAFNGQNIEAVIKAGDPETAARINRLLTSAGATVEAGEKELTVNGDYGRILTAMLADADLMFANDGTAMSEKHGYNERQALFDWYTAAKSMEKHLLAKEMFKEATVLSSLLSKGIEPAYNYYGIESTSIKDKIWTVVLSLVGYVIYTLWFGFAILFMFEGWGLRLEH